MDPLGPSFERALHLVVHPYATQIQSELRSELLWEASLPLTTVIRLFSNDIAILASGGSVIINAQDNRVTNEWDEDTEAAYNRMARRTRGGASKAQMLTHSAGTNNSMF